MVEIKLNGQDAYSAIAEYIKRYWEHHGIGVVIISIGLSTDGKEYTLVNDVVEPIDCGDSMEFLDDWWEGEKFIRLFGIKDLSELAISGGIYEN